MQLQGLKISQNRRFLATEDGAPFFWLGDTAWELFHKLSREEAELYLNNRKEWGFNVIQAVALAELDGLTVPNAYGCLPLLKNESGAYDPKMPDLSGEYSYWDHVDYIVGFADSIGMYIGFLPAWGDKFNMKWGKGPEIFTPENAKRYGKWLGERYRDRNNIIWILGGDRPLETEDHYAVVRGMAEGLAEGDGGRHLRAFHPVGCQSSSDYVHEEEWLDFHMCQSGHSFDIANYKWVEADYQKTPVRPVLDGEPRYEDHPINFNPENGYYDAADTRQAAYWAVFAGGFGHTYGHHSIWCMNTEPAVYHTMHWKDAIMQPGGSQVQHMRRLLQARPFFERVPDQDLIAENYEGFDHLQAARGAAYAFLYTPTGKPVSVQMGRITGASVKAGWYDPRDGSFMGIGTIENTGVRTFTPPASGRGQDWVLVLEDADKEFSPIG